MMTKSKEVEGLAKLREPFPPNLISKLPKPLKRDAPKGKCAECGGYHGLPAIHLDYVGHAALTSRLLDTDPEWTWEPVALNDGLPAFDRTGGLWIRLTVLGVTRLGYGSADGKQGGDAVKEIIGDALRNAAMRFGAALDLWHKGDLHGDEQTNGDTGEVIDDAQYTAFVKLSENAGADVQKFCEYFKVEKLTDLRAADYDRAIELLQSKLAKKIKADTEAKAQGFGEMLDDEIPY